MVRAPLGSSSCFCRRKRPRPLGWQGCTRPLSLRLPPHADRCFHSVLESRAQHPQPEQESFQCRGPGAYPSVDLLTCLAASPHAAAGPRHTLACDRESSAPTATLGGPACKHIRPRPLPRRRRRAVRETRDGRMRCPGAVATRTASTPRLLIGNRIYAYCEYSPRTHWESDLRVLRVRTAYSLGIGFTRTASTHRVLIGSLGIGFTRTASTHRVLIGNRIYACGATRASLIYAT